jgi:glutamate/tyrosine decarboxylase-like PLP-dependent enzyme
MDDGTFVRLAQLARDFRASRRDRSPLPRSNFPASEELEQEYDFTRPHDIARIVDDVARWLQHGILQVTHPRYFGLFNPSVHDSSIVADALAAMYNPQVGGWTHGPAANEIEQWTLRALARALGWDGQFATHFTSGGSEANHTAVLAALGHRLPAFCEGGSAALERAPRIYVSDESHHSFVKIARACGLGENALTHVPVDASFRMRATELERAIARDREAGRFPLMVVATAGTTGSGAIDPLRAVADVAAVQDLWLHVDAAWGGSAALAPGLRPLLDGIERADSVTWDAHKWLSVSMGAGMFFCRHRDALRRMFTVSTGYIPDTMPGSADLYKESLQWSRRFIGLKVFFALAEHGLDGLGRIIQGQADTADLLRQRLRDAGWHIVNDCALPLVCFSHPAIDGGSLTTQQVMERVLARGRCWISHVTLAGGVTALRACITSFESNADDIDVLLTDLTEAVA